jgi:hypothetical protein
VSCSRNVEKSAAGGLTVLVRHRTSVAPSLDKGTPGESRGRKATGPRLLRDARLKDASKAQDRRAAVRLARRLSFVRDLALQGGPSNPHK